MKAKIELSEQQIHEIIKRDFSARGIQVSHIIFHHRPGNQYDNGYTNAELEVNLPQHTNNPSSSPYDR